MTARGTGHGAAPLGTLEDTILLKTERMRTIDVDSATWTWHMRGISALGVSVTPTFTELMTFDEPASIRFEPRPPADTGPAQLGRLREDFVPVSTPFGMRWPW